MYLRKNNQSFTKFQLLQGQLAIEIENSKSIDYCRITKKLIEPSLHRKLTGQFWKPLWITKKFHAFLRFFTEINLF